MKVEEIKEKIIPILKQAGVIRSAIFGSYARGEETATSDLDILVDLPEDKSLLDLIGLQQTLEESLHIKVDVLTYDYLHPRLRDYIMHDQIPIL
ncbi:MAG: hypothetical protein UY30_C0010G0007 [Parcubacteria group bacterium GW2011_GWB1_48_6]|nr:MAG: hypothetical protein UY30_C0010G0007 [Parcubacteria group bacterium GW2011_GWB1_48_6]HXK35775.1 nucleotidyltransferase family protein [Candidatus Paceibacterota bacterium]